MLLHLLVSFKLKREHCTSYDISRVKYEGGLYFAHANLSLEIADPLKFVPLVKSS